ncbi:hypothetical protein [Sphingopyxis granuli]|uniref:ParB/Sulfiredoxin domain-containing protein n=1 Tax=Sphingopyxis granuli TaxID=267128 RepID=A0AA86GMB5_9SPHN|nr:hypothetical protein [Sphingopyxis granuli]AMG75463.1 Uncharacterized protein SGRAN_3117 [Sphingopyxis granuli]
MVTRLEIDVDRIFLDQENPRHKPYETQSEVIEYLCSHESILTLARDIAANGLNPIEQFALIPDDDADDDSSTYVVAEGNRRICALKLLHDPDLAPAKLRNGFSQAASGWPGVGPLPCVVFDDRKAVDLWLKRIHDGEQGGMGRRKWSSDQSARHSGSNKDKLALKILDYAEKKGLISSDERKGTLTTVSRYVTKAPVQAAFGIDATDLNKIRLTKSEGDFDTLLGKFLGDLASGHVNSRAKGVETFTAYGRELESVPVSGQGKVVPGLLDINQSRKPSARRRTKIKPRATLAHEHEIMDALKAVNSQKLISLYNSITIIPLTPHAPLVSVGAWAFLESLATKAGADENTNFLSFFSRDRRAKYGLPTGKGSKAITEALNQVSASGDVTKHDGTAALFNGEQLANNMDTLKELIIQCIKEIENQSP